MLVSVHKVTSVKHWSTYSYYWNKLYFGKIPEVLIISYDFEVDIKYPARYSVFLIIHVVGKISCVILFCLNL